MKTANTEAMDEFAALCERTLWRPIETCPKEHCIDILISTNGDGIHVGHWNNVWECFMDNYGAPFGTHALLKEAPWCEAQFWMPLPTPPEYID